MIGNLGSVAIGDQCGDRNKTSITGGEIGTEPQITEQDIGRVLDDSGSYFPELLFNARRALLLGLFVEREQVSEAAGT
jgi:hypothetical protein